VDIFINVSGKQKGVIYFNEQEILFRETWDEKGREAEHVLPALQRGAATTGGTIEDVNRVIIVRGPGSFTGVRVAITVINTLGNVYPSLRVAGLTIGEFYAALDNARADAYIFQVYASDAFVFTSDGTFVHRVEPGAVRAEQYGVLKGEVLDVPCMVEALPEVASLTHDDLMRIAHKATIMPVPIVPFYGKGANITQPRK